MSNQHKSLITETTMLMTSSVTYQLWTPGGLIIPFEVDEDLQAKLSVLADEMSSPDLIARELAYETGLKVTVTTSRSATSEYIFSV